MSLAEWSEAGSIHMAFVFLSQCLLTKGSGRKSLVASGPFCKTNIKPEPSQRVLGFFTCVDVCIVHAVTYTKI